MPDHIECRSIADRCIDRESVDGWSTLGRWSVDIATDYRPTIGRYCADASRSSIGQISRDIKKFLQSGTKKSLNEVKSVNQPHQEQTTHAME